jgi:hypothetical protein
MTLQYANSNISTTQTYGQWAFVPVTDYNFIKSPPSVALHGNRVNGGRILANNNANEGAILTPQTIQTLDDLKEWIRPCIPRLTMPMSRRSWVHIPVQMHQTTQTAQNSQRTGGKAQLQ